MAYATSVKHGVGAPAGVLREKKFTGYLHETSREFADPEADISSVSSGEDT